MPASVREYRTRIQTVESTRKITRAMELIASARVVRAREAAAAARPYSRRMTRAISAAAATAHIHHPLLMEKTDDSNRAAILVVTSDRGLADAYSANVLRTAERLISRIDNEGRDVALYCFGRKGLTYFTFRGRPVAASWVGSSDRPTFDLACDIGDTLIEQFLTENTGVDDVHLVYTRFHSMVDHELMAVRMLPTEVVGGSRFRHPRRYCRCTTSSPVPRQSWTRSCRTMCTTASTRSCCKRPPVSTRLGSGR